MFPTLPKFEWGCFSCPKFHLGCCFYSICKSAWNSSNLPDGSNSTQVWMKLFQLPNIVEAVRIFPNVSNCMQISTQHLYTTQIGMKLFEVHLKWIKLFELPQNWIKLFEVTQNWLKMLKIFHLAKFEWSYCYLTRVGLVCWNLSKFFQFMKTFLTSPKFEWSCPNLPKFHWDC